MSGIVFNFTAVAFGAVQEIITQLFRKDLAMGVFKSVAPVLRRSWEKNWPDIQAAVKNGFPDFIFRARPHVTPDDITVFCYHIVSGDALASDLKFLERNRYKTIDADAMLDHLRGRRNSKEPAVVLTFDDGASNLYKVVFPLLMRYKMKAVAFIAPHLHREISEVDEESEKFSYGEPLTWEEIREMHASDCVDFQSHTYEHRYIPRWPEALSLEGSDPKLINHRQGLPLSLEDDLHLAKTVLEQKLGKSIRHLAFPRFKGTAQAVRIAQEVGYEGFWWGVLPNRPGNRVGQAATHIVRLDARYLKRLPGQGRASLSSILKARYKESPRRLFNHFRGKRSPINSMGSQ